MLVVPAYAADSPAPAAGTSPGPPALSPGAQAPAQSALSANAADVVKLAKSGVGDDVVMAYIKGSQAPYNLSATDILALKKAGLSEQLITAMLNHDSSLRHQPQPPSYEQKLYAPASVPAAMPSVAANSQSTFSDAPSALLTVPPQGPPVASPGAAPAPAAPSTPQQPPASTSATIVEQAPPPPQVEVVPVTPGPDYYWVPGYWTWRGTWVWVGGRWAVRPWHGAVWVGGHWGRHGHGYIWIGGQWH